MFTYTGVYMKLASLNGSVAVESKVYAKGSEASTEDRGELVGMVDFVHSGEYIKLKRSVGPGRFHWIPYSWIEKTESKSVVLNRSFDDFKRDRLTKRPFGL